MGWDRHKLLWNGMGWDRKICPMDKPVRYYSHKCLYGKAGAALLIDAFQLGKGDCMIWRGKIAPYLGETLFQF